MKLKESLKKLKESRGKSQNTMDDEDSSVISENPANL